MLQSTQRLGRASSLVAVLMLGSPAIVAGQFPSVRCADGTTASSATICTQSHGGVAKPDATVAWQGSSTKAPPVTSPQQKGANGWIEIFSFSEGTSQTASEPKGAGDKAGKVSLPNLGTNAKTDSVVTNIPLKVPVPDTVSTKPPSKKR